MIESMKEKLKNFLRKRRARYIKDIRRLSSAVVLPLFLKNDEWHILFIKRTDTVEHHKGQVSFPGGRREPEDRTLKNTALREFYEEIGIPPENIEVLGKLDDGTTLSSNYIVSPYVVLIPYPYEFKPDAREIAYIFDVPVSKLLSAGSFKMEERYLEGRQVKSYFFDAGHEIIWGATARILRQFLEIWKTLEQEALEANNS